MLASNARGPRATTSDGTTSGDGSSPSIERLGRTTRAVVGRTIPRDLDRDLPGRGVAHGFEIGITPVFFAGLGWLVDRLAGTLPVFTIAFTVLSFVGLFVRYYYSYKASMEAEDAAWAAAHPGVARRYPVIRDRTVR